MDATKRARLRAAVQASVPERPGVYTWLSAAGERLYVGKSRNLRKRMLSYLVPVAARPDARTRNLVSGIDRFEWQETTGELMALLLEDALIKRFEPRHNERQKDYRERMYLLLTDDAFPACVVTDGCSGRAGTLWGPFKDEYFCRDLRAILTDDLGLRACTDAEPVRKSARYDLGQCPGPCRGAISAEQYGSTVSAVRAFLEGDATGVVATLAAKMDEASAALQFERAALLRDRLEFCGRFATRQRFFRQFREGRLVVRDAAAGLIFDFDQGTIARASARTGELVHVPPELVHPPADPRAFLDRANILYAWGSTPGANA